MKKFSLILLIFLFLGFNYSQELNATVNINYEQLNIKYKDKLVKFGQEIEDYLNKTKFSGNNWDWERIKCNFNIFFTSAGNETNYSAQVVVTSQRSLPGSNNYCIMLSLLDNSWSFKYELGNGLYYNEGIYDPLTSFLDFYAYLIIGLDSDSYEPLGGTDMFNKALNLSALASGQNKPGWELKMNTFTKRGLIEDILKAQFVSFREYFYKYHMEGLEIFTQNKQVAQKNMASFIENLFTTRESRDNRSVFMKVFFDSKFKEISDYLADYPDKSIFEKLKIIDPAHISKYNEILNK